MINRREVLKAAFLLGVLPVTGCSVLRIKSKAELAQEAREELSAITRDVNELNEVLEALLDNYIELAMFFTSDQAVDEDLSSETVIIDIDKPAYSNLMMLQTKVGSLTGRFREIREEKFRPRWAPSEKFSRIELDKVSDESITKGVGLADRFRSMLDKAERAGIVVNDLADMKPEVLMRALEHEPKQ